MNPINLAENATIANIGCGTALHEHPCVNIDLDWSVRPDFVINLNKDRLPFKDNQLEKVYAQYIFEYLTHDGFFHCMRELYRVCKNDASIVVSLASCEDRSRSSRDILHDPAVYRTNLTMKSFNNFSKKLNNLGDTVSNLGLFYNVDFEVDVQKLVIPGYASSFYLRVVKK